MAFQHVSDNELADYVFRVPTEHFGDITVAFKDNGNSMMVERARKIRCTSPNQVIDVPQGAELSGLVEEFYSDYVDFQASQQRHPALQLLLESLPFYMVFAGETRRQQSDRFNTQARCISTILLGYGVAKGAVDYSYSIR